MLKWTHFVVLFIVSHLSKHVAIDYGLFYMYDLDEEFWWRWPVSESNCSRNGYVGHEYSHLSGMGTAIAKDKGLFLTWHFSLFSSLYNRYKWSSRRTLDPEKASIFIIPYDLGLDGYINKYTCEERQHCSDGLVKKLETYLLNSTYWQRYQGADHVVLWSLGQYHPWPRNGCDRFIKFFCSKCTFTCYWMDSARIRDNRFVSIPFPSAYHWWDGIKILPWSEDHTTVATTSTSSSSSSVYDSTHPNRYDTHHHHHSQSTSANITNRTTTTPTVMMNSMNRNLTVVYLGSTQTLNPSHTKIRRAMTNQCNLSIHCHWKQIAHSSKDSRIVQYVEIYKQAIFCLCPPGDDPARKAVFDAILSGCIPVIFEKATLYNQYFWHFQNEQTALDISVYIPGNKIRTGAINMMNVLMKIPWKVIRLKQLMIEKIAPRLQYAIPPFHLLITNSDIINHSTVSSTDIVVKNFSFTSSITSSSSTSTSWDPPFLDAAEIALNGLIARVHNVLNNESTLIPPPYMLEKRWNLQYEHVIIKVPKIIDNIVDASSNSTSNNIINSRKLQ